MCNSQEIEKREKEIARLRKAMAWTSKCLHDLIVSVRTNRPTSQMAAIRDEIERALAKEG
jgi:Xaa-Pro aminopeptidase